MERLLVDMDGVLADVYAQFAAYELRETGHVVDYHTMQEIDEVVAFPNGLKHVHQPGFFAGMNPIEKSIAVMEQLYHKYEVFIVSAAMEFPNSLKEKHDWLAEHFPFISWKRIILCGSKTPVQGAYLIDDHFKNLDLFPNNTLLFDQPHNRFLEAGRHQRVKNWEEIAGILL